MLPKLIILFLYFAILFLIGYWSSKKIKDIKDFYVGGKKLGFWVVAFSVRATGESAWLLLGLTGLGAIAGVSALWVVVGEVIGVSLSWLLMAKRFKRFSDIYESITIPDYLVSRFKSKTHHLRLISSIILSVFVVIFVSAQIDATGSAFEAFLDWNYFVGVLVGFGIVLAYILFGGFIAVAWSDLFQGILMFFGLILLPILGFFMLRDDVSLWSGLHQIDPDLTNIWGPGGLTGLNIATLIGYLCIGLGFLGSPQVYVRFMSIKNKTEINKGTWVAIIFTLLTDTAAVFIGLLARYFFTSSGVDVESILGINAQNSLIHLVEYLLPLFFIGVYIAVVLAAIMSTIDSLLVVASSAVVRDIYQQVLNPKVKLEKLTSLSRQVTFSMALGALLLALIIAVTVPGRTIFWFVIFGWSGIAASFCPMIILSLFWKGYTEKGAIASMISGFLSIPVFKFILPSLPEVGIYFDRMAELGPSFIVGLLAGYLVSIWKPDPNLEEHFEQMVNNK
jgi:sodium/proline symporter